MNFHLTSTEAELLILFEQNPSLEMLANSLGRDPTAISRQLKRIYEKGDFLVKVSGRWKITETGQKLNQATKDYLLTQNQILKEETHLRIGSTREFCSRVLAPQIKDLEQILGVSSLSLISLEGSTEKALLSGAIDLAFDCGRPYSPEIRYKQVVKEPIAPVVSKELFKKYNQIEHFKDLENYPHILCDRLHPDRVSKKLFFSNNIAHSCNDIAIARSLCLASRGWALLPLYTVKDELKSRELKIIRDFSFSYTSFGVWQLRERKSLHDFFEGAVGWLARCENLLS